MWHGNQREAGMPLRRRKITRGPNLDAREHCGQRLRRQYLCAGWPSVPQYQRHGVCDRGSGAGFGSAGSVLHGHSRMSAATYDAIIVGAGIVGAACANECVRQGLRVAIVDSDVPASGATAAGMGHIVVMDDSEAQFALTRYSQQLWQALRSDLPSDVEYEQTGTIWVAADEEEMIEVQRKRAYYGERGVHTQVLDAEELQNLEPNLRSGMAGGLLVPEDGVLYPPCAAVFLMDRAQARGARLMLGAKVSRI